MTRTTYVVPILCATVAVGLHAQTFTSIFGFNDVDGANPSAALIQATDGNLYGVTDAGGIHHNCVFTEGCGTLFRITPDGQLTKLYDFCAQTGCADGANPAGLIQATDGNFYGTTSGGGANGYGTAFKFTPDGTLTILHSFCSELYCKDGDGPTAPLIQAWDGNFYGTTTGINGTTGNVFQMTPDGTVTSWYNFTQNGLDGAVPRGPLVQGFDGYLYGTTSLGGIYNNGGGTLFKISPQGPGVDFTSLYSFCSPPSCADGAGPVGALVQAADGNLYGTTYWEGNAGHCNNGLGCGTIFKITPAGALTTLYTFCSQADPCPDNSTGPTAGLILASDGNLYGTGNGIDLDGTLFQITPSGVFTTLHNFFCPSSARRSGPLGHVCTDGSNPRAGLVQTSDGRFFGSTEYGGSYFYGTIFSLSAGLAPFVKIQPAAAKIGAQVEILGSNLTGAGSVTFNGSPAEFRVASPSLIFATVPAGAASGKVEVVAPNGALSSIIAFHVLP